MNNISITITAFDAENAREQMRRLLGEGRHPVEQFPSRPSPVEPIVTGAETTTSEPEIVPPAPKARSRKPKKTEDVTDIDTNGDPVVEAKPEPAPPPADATLPESEGPKHDEVRAAARDFNAKFGSDELIALLKTFGATGARGIFRSGKSDEFIAAVKAKLAEAE